MEPRGPHSGPQSSTQPKCQQGLFPPQPRVPSMLRGLPRPASSCRPLDLSNSGGTITHRCVAHLGGMWNPTNVSPSRLPTSSDNSGIKWPRDLQKSPLFGLGVFVMVNFLCQPRGDTVPDVSSNVVLDISMSVYWMGLHLN